MWVVAGGVLSFLYGFRGVSSYEGHVQVGYGYDNNIFRSPPEYRPANTLANALVDPRQQDAFLFLHTEHEFRGVFRGGHRLSFYVDGEWLRFRRYTEYSEYDVEGGLKYRHRVGRGYRLYFRGDVRRAHQRLFNILGQGLTRLFTFTEFSVGHWQRWKPVRRVVLRPEVGVRYRDYVEVPNRMSLDNWRFSSSLELQVQMGEGRHHQLFVRPYMQYRWYLGWVVRDSQGNRLPGYPLRRYWYRGIAGGYQLDVDRFLLTVSGYWEARRDNFQQWYGYDELGVQVVGKWDWVRWRLWVYGGFRDRDWLRKKGYLVDGSKPPLYWRYYQVGVRAVYFWFSWLGMYFSVRYVVRETNVEVPFRRTNRPYQAVVLHGGLYLYVDVGDRRLKSVSRR